MTDPSETEAARPSEYSPVKVGGVWTSGRILSVRGLLSFFNLVGAVNFISGGTLVSFGSGLSAGCAISIGSGIATGCAISIGSGTSIGCAVSIASGRAIGNGYNLLIPQKQVSGAAAG
ncbi:MAG: hypothetical protein WAT58_04260 [Candidatus Dormiibacterota bacterium]